MNQPDRMNTEAFRVPARLFVILAFSSLMLGACKGPAPEEETNPTPVQALSVTMSTTGDPYVYPGTVEGTKKVMLSTKVMGQVSSLPFSEGAHVRAGEVVARISSGDLSAKRSQIQAGRDQAMAVLRNVETNFNRIRTLYNSQSATQKELDDISTAYESAQAKVREIEEMQKELDDVLRYAELVSPIDGIVVGKYTEEGNLTSPGSPIIAIEDTRRLKVAITVPESEISFFRLHMPVEVQTDANQDASPIEGEVDAINGGSNAGSHDFNVEVLLSPGLHPALRPGMFASVHIEGPGVERIALPDSLLVRRGGLEGVYTVSSAQEAVLRLVRTGQRFSGGRVEILSGLSPGELVVAAKSEHLRDGMRIKVTP